MKTSARDPPPSLAKTPAKRRQSLALSPAGGIHQNATDAHRFVANSCCFVGWNGGSSPGTV